MMHRSVNTVAKLGVMLALVLGAGYVLPETGQLMAPDYVAGDFKAFYPDARTKVVIYGAGNCPYCAEARAYLKQRNIAFVDFDVNDAAKGRQDYTALHGQVVPLILIGGRRLDGYNEKAIEDALEELSAS
ncbi:glutaredoxin family protein [Massilia sp. ZL223]|uniref:glutaredoxin family protein n=1 Tax=Massilia sp. ZL223 TaxID=2824904 RepID=UPI001B82A7A5|nr:glutaredoxin family protein [Massilia sp. ZL223]MBQ5961853.1 glutaredoxin family protein [Massilia sp. ZL223]